MRTRRGSSFYSGGLGELIDRLRVDDVVSYVLNDGDGFSGIVRDVDRKTNKVTVAWAGGIVRQHDPEEIALNYHVYDADEIVERWGGPVEREMTAQDTLVEHAEKNPQFVGDPKTHGLDTPVGGGFSIMQNLQKKLHRESEEESGENPKEAGNQREALTSLEKRIMKAVKDQKGGKISMPDILRVIGEYPAKTDGPVRALNALTKDGSLSMEFGRGGIPTYSIPIWASVEAAKEMVARVVQKLVTTWEDDGTISKTKEDRTRTALLERWALPPGAKVIKEDVRHPTIGEDGTLVKLRNRRVVWLSDQGRQKDVPTKWEKMYASMSSGQYSTFKKVKEGGKLLGFGKFKNEHELDDYYLYKGDVWRVTNRSVVNQGAVDDFNNAQIRKKASEVDYSQLKSRRAMYWGGPGRQYRLTKQEQDQGSVVCPRCKSEVSLKPFTKQEKIYTCDDCGFMIPTGKVMKERVKIEIEPDGEVEIEIASKVAKEIEMNREAVAQELTDVAGLLVAESRVASRTNKEVVGGNLIWSQPAVVQRGYLGFIVDQGDDLVKEANKDVRILRKVGVPVRLMTEGDVLVNFADRTVFVGSDAIENVEFYESPLQELGFWV